jgi:hypothetical protein
MRATAYVYESASADTHVDAVLDLLATRTEDVDRIDVSAHDDRAAARREAMLTVKSAVRVGSPPAALFDEDGDPDFSTGALVTEASTGRRSLHVGADALERLQEAREGP